MGLKLTFVVSAGVERHPIDALVGPPPLRRASAVDKRIRMSRKIPFYLYHSVLMAAMSRFFHSSFQSFQYGISCDEGAGSH